MLQAGKLDRQITIQSVTDSKGTVGAPKETYANWLTVWAQVIPANVMERYRNRQTVTVEDLVFRIRWEDGLTTRHRIVHDSENYEILSVREINRREGWEILARLVK
ncbi:MAG: phage head closure protein [Candidatus Marinimicrobia bacterium]|nr:phage head closure protein [Candidatus Neomarinimicrobiota bacterium]